MRFGFHAILLLLPVVAAACGAPQELSDEAKIRRIEALYAEYRESFEEVPGLTPDEVAARLGGADEPLLVDVRTAAEQAVSMIPGAITREEFERRRERIGDRAVVTYCTIGYRSGLYAAELRADGWEAFNLEGSILSWTHRGGDLVDDEGETRRVHVFGRQWDLAASGYDTVW